MTLTPNASERTARRAGDEGRSVDSTADSTVGPHPPGGRPSNAPGFGPPTEKGDIGRLGKYRIKAELGRGGMGAVYLAFDVRLHRDVALKVMLPEAAANPASKERFLREARAAARISSDHVVGIYEADEIDGSPYISLQHLKGASLEDYLKRKGPVTISQAIRVARETALGLAAAHKLGIVHRDVKPANVWLEAPTGRAKLLDFGLAKPVSSTEDADITASGTVLGTPMYLSPEQGMGRGVDARSDLFSLGCMLYRLVTGRMPFEGPTMMALFTAIATQEPAPVQTLNRDAPEALCQLIHRLLAKNPADRPASADEVAVELSRIRRSTSADKAVPANSRAPSDMGGEINPFGEPAEPITRSDDGGSRRGRGRFAIAAAAGFIALFVLVAVIIIRITNRDGTVTEIKVADGSKIEINGKAFQPDEAKATKSGSSAATAGAAGAAGSAMPAAITPAISQTMSRLPNGLVTTPAKIPGVRRWTVETKLVRGIFGWMVPNPQGTLLAGTSSSGVVHLLDAKTLKPVQFLYAPYTQGGQCLWSKDGGRLAVHMWDFRGDRQCPAAIVVFDVAAGRVERTIDFAGQISSFAWSPDGSKFIVTLFNFGDPSREPERAVVVDAKTGRPIRTLESGRFAGAIWNRFTNRIYFHHLYSGLSIVQCHDGDSGAKLFKTDHLGGASVQIDVSPDGSRLLTLANNGEAAIRDAGTGQILDRLIIQRSYQPRRPSWSPDGAFFSLPKPNKEIDVYSVKPFRLANTIASEATGWTLILQASWLRTGESRFCFVGERFSGLSEPSSSVRLVERPDWVTNWSVGPRVSGTLVHSGARVYNVTDGRSSPLSVHAPGSGANPSAVSPDLSCFISVEGGIQSVRRCSDGKVLLSVPESEGRVDWLSSDLVAVVNAERMDLRELPSGKVVSSLKTGVTTYNLSWSPKDRRIYAEAGNGSGRKVVGWDVASGSTTFEVVSPLARPWVSPDGGLLAVCGWGGAWVLARDSTSRLHRPQSSYGWAMGALWTSDGSVLLLGDEMGLVQQFNGRTGQPVGRVLRSDGSQVRGLSWLVPDKVLLILGNAGSISAVDVATGVRIGGALQEERRNIHPMVVGADGHVRGDKGFEENILYVAELDDGSVKTFAPADFTKRFGWKNDPDRARLDWLPK